MPNRPPSPPTKTFSYFLYSSMNVHQLNLLTPLERCRHNIATVWETIKDIDFSTNPPDILLPDAQLQSFLVDELTSEISQYEASDDPYDLKFIPFALLSKALAHVARFRTTGELGDIDEAITLLEIVAHLPDSNPSQVAGFMSKLAELRYGHTRGTDDLDRLIQSEEALLQFEDLRSEPRFFRLAFHLDTRFNATNDIAYVERLLSLSEEVSSLSADSYGLHYWSMIKGAQIKRLSNMGRKFSDIRQAFDLVEETTNYVVSLNPKISHIPYQFLAEQLKFAALNGDLPQLREIGRIALNRPEHTKWEFSFVDIFQNPPEAELDESIALLRAGCNATDPGDECMPMYTLALASALLLRYHSFRKYQDIQDAIAFRAPFALFSAFLIDPMLFISAVNLHLEFKEKFRMVLDAYIRDDSQAWLASTPKPLAPHQLVDRLMKLICMRNSWSFQELDSVNIFDGSQYRRHEFDNRDFHLTYLQLQAEKYVQRYHALSHDQADLEQAIVHRQQIVDLLPHDHCDPYDGVHKLQLVHDLYSLHVDSKSLSIHQLRTACDYSYAVANDQRAAISDRRDAAMIWFHLHTTNTLYNEQKHRVSEMCDTWLSIMKEHNWLSNDLRATLLLQRMTNQFLPNIVIAFILATSGTKPFISRALWILESGRSLLWEQVQSLRTTSAAGANHNFKLFAQLEEASMALKRHLGLTSSPDPEHKLGYHSHRAHKERHQIIEEIRLIPGFEDALQDNTQFGINERSILEGPIVTLLATEFICVTIIVTETGHVIRPLPITLRHLKQLHDGLRDFTKSRSAISPEEVDFSTDDDGSSVASTSSHRAGRKSHHHSAQSVERILEYLWDNVAKPVLDIIWEMKGFNTKEKGRDSRKPLLHERERIWWCCVGEFSFIPIHAAGIYQGDVSTSVSDYFVSSYTPTIGALLRVRERSLPNGCKILTVAQPDPWAGRNKLPSVRDELQKILDIVPHDNLIPLGDSEKLDPEGKDATVDNVVSKLPDANILHIACHGVQDLKDPLNSGFILANGKKLTIEEIMKLDLPNAHTAILSACHTASNDPAVPDESINLATALLYAGFSSILGTMWPMSDGDGPLIAEEVYTALFKSQRRPSQFRPDILRRWIRPDSKDWGHLCRLRREGVEIESSAEFKIKLKCSMSIRQAMAELQGSAGRSLYLLALPEIVDGIARKLRAQGAPASRWATFIHIGV